MKELLENLKRTMAQAPSGSRSRAPLASRRILFVCMGNICRSPTAEGVFRKLLAEQAPELDVQIDSAGTHGYHDGAPPDPRACRAAERRGVDLKPLRARRVTAAGLRALRARARDGRAESGVPARGCAPPSIGTGSGCCLEFAPHLERREVPDPYYGGSTGFEHVLDLVEEAAAGLLEHLRRTEPPAPRDPPSERRAAASPPDVRRSSAARTRARSAADARLALARRAARRDSSVPPAVDQLVLAALRSKSDSTGARRAAPAPP